MRDGERTPIELSSRPPSQCERLLGILADGGWHSSRELHSRVFCVLHSRVAELRKRGHQVEHRGGGAGTDVHEYRLVASCGVGVVADATLLAVPAPLGANSLGGDNTAGRGFPGALTDARASVPASPPEVTSGQLSVFDLLGAVA